MKKTDANVFYYNSFQNKTASDRPGRPLTEETVSYFYILIFIRSIARGRNWYLL